MDDAHDDVVLNDRPPFKFGQIKSLQFKLWSADEFNQKLSNKPKGGSTVADFLVIFTAALQLIASEQAMNIHGGE